MFMMFHSNAQRKPWLVAGFGLLLAVGIGLLFWMA
jgi:hypothetical protein